MTNVTRWLPREHGAWAQLAFPMLTAHAVAGVTIPGALLSVAAVAAFLGHEPLLVLTGGRGARKQEAERRSAARAALGATALAMIAAGAALVLSGPSVRLTMVLLALPVAALVALVFVGRNKTTLGELLASASFSALALPLAVSAERGASGLAVAGTWALCFALSTFSVRGVTVRAHGKRDPEAQRAARTLGLVGALLGAAVLAASLAAVVLGKLPAAIAGGIAPFALFSIVCWFAPPRPASLKRVGWGLAGSCLVTFGLLAAGLQA